MREPLSIGQLPAPARGQSGSTSPQATTAESPIPENWQNLKMIHMKKWDLFFKKCFVLKDR